MAKYTIGIDFGSLSGRAVVADVSNGRELATASFDYPHAVMDETLPSGKALPPDWALQYPQDYIDVLRETIPAVLRESGVSPEDVIGIGTDFTACTMIPVKADGTPLCMLPEFQDEPHAYVKLWKHHAAQYKATALNEIAAQRGEEWLPRYGGKISSEWEIPKIWQILEEAPHIYDAMDAFVEASDWIVWQLTGVRTKNSCAAGFKGIYNKQKGYPSKDFFKALDPRLENVIQDKMNCPVSPLGSVAGYLTPEMARLTGLRPGIPVAVGIIDAHVNVPSAAIDQPNSMLAIMGTSTCHILFSEEERSVPGMCGVVEDGVYPGYFGYEAGQSCVGDHFAWFVKNCCPACILEEAKAAGKSAHEILQERAMRQKPGESGLVALDWWNGNRSVLVDVDLTGMMLGMTLQTKPEEMYRALVEATAYGTRKIVRSLVDGGIPVNSFYASGGISQKSPMTMQIYADVLNLPIHICGSSQGAALGSAIFGAVAAGKAAGGYDSLFEAAKAMGNLKDTVYRPIPENVALYDRLYEEYNILHDYFGRGANDVMKRLKALRAQLTGVKND